MANSLLISRIPVRYADLVLIHQQLETYGSLSFPQLTQQLTPNWNSYLASSATLLRETLSFGTTLGLYQSSDERAWENRYFHSQHSHALLRPTILSLLNQQTDPAQRAFKGLHDTLINLGKVQTTVSELIELMELGPYGQVFKWNNTKVNFWSHFFHDLGLILHLPPERLICSPSTALLLDLLPLQGGPLRLTLDGWHQNFCRVFTCLGEVHEGFARALLRLEQQGHLNLHYASDASGSLLLCGRRVSHWTRKEYHVDSH